VEKAATYVFAGGASGGHLFPGLAVAEELRARQQRIKIVFIGSERGIEREIVREHNCQHEPLPVEPSTMFRRNPVRFLWRNWQARNRAATLLDELQPAAVIGLGGFASVPVVMAASSRNIPTALLEQNIVSGRATRWLSSRASMICHSFDKTYGRLASGTATFVTGNPVGKQIADLRHRSQATARHAAPTLLILGGSQGATAVNKMAFGAIERLHQPVLGATGVSPVRISDWTIMHQTGAAQHDEIARCYAELGLQAETAPFFTDMPRRYAQATVAITRGGATSLAELAVVGVPAIIVPYPDSIGDHQRLNARFYEENGAARVVEQRGDSVAEMTDAIAELATDPLRLRAMADAMHALGKPDAAADVAEQLLHLTGGQQVQRRRSA
jgi:UDP-N-acetylglucosamine--N-acetylmuramyl-(pentapeptide) pyrophosphoryl-undecaprenol N-acetylglucosamine transferase